MQSGKIIQIADLINDKLRKEQELEFYEEELQKLMVQNRRQGQSLQPMQLRVRHTLEAPLLRRPVKLSSIPSLKLQPPGIRKSSPVVAESALNPSACR